MATLVRDIERPAFLDRPSDGQLSFGAVAAPARESVTVRDGGSGRESLAERLRAERAAAAGAASAKTVMSRGGGATLDELLVGAWEGLSAHRPVPCPVCARSMHPRERAPGGACEDCGSQLR